MSTVIIGLSLGMLLFLLASGLTLIFGMLGVINFAHGALYMLGAYLAFDIHLRTGSFVAGLVVATAGVGLVGVAMERLALRPLYNRPHFYQLILTFGFILVISEAVKFIWGLGYQETPMPALLAGTVDLAGSTIPVYRLFVIAFGLLVSVTLFFVLEKSTFGMLVRAASSDGEMVRTLGLPAASIRTAVFGLGAGLAGLADAIAAPLFPVEPGSNNEEFQSPLRGLDNMILTPHIGGSTMEAQANIGGEVAEKLVKYSDNGTSISSVNFPEVALPAHPGKHRLLHIHHNVPGVLSEINKIFSDNHINISSQYLQTNEKVGYVVTDIDAASSDLALEKLAQVPGTIRSRVLF